MVRLINNQQLNHFPVKDLNASKFLLLGCTDLEPITQTATMDVENSVSCTLSNSSRASWNTMERHISAYDSI